MELPTKPTQPKTSFLEYTTLVYGEPKIGKTTFASQMDSPLFLATEAGLNALEAYQVPIAKWEDFLEACALVSKGNHQFKTIIIDTIDNLIKFCVDFICKKNNVQSESDLPYGKGYALVRNEILRVLTKMSLLPYGLVLISHSKTEEIKTRTSVINKDMPSIQKSYRELILGMVDLILFAHTIQTTDENDKPVLKRVLETRASENFEAGNRTTKQGLMGTIPFEYTEFKKAWESDN